MPSRDLPRYLGLFRRGRLPVDRLLTDRLRLDEINEGFDVCARARRCARSSLLIERPFFLERRQQPQGQNGDDRDHDGNVIAAKPDRNTDRPGGP